MLDVGFVEVLFRGHEQRRLPGPQAAVPGFRPDHLPERLRCTPLRTLTIRQSSKACKPYFATCPSCAVEPCGVGCRPWFQSGHRQARRCAAEFNATVVDRLEGHRLCTGVMFKELFLEPGDLEGVSGITRIPLRPQVTWQHACERLPAPCAQYC